MAPDDPCAGSPHRSSRDADDSTSKQNATRNNQDGASSNEHSTTPEVSRSSLDLRMSWRCYSSARKSEAASPRTLKRAHQKAAVKSAVSGREMHRAQDDDSLVGGRERAER